MPPVPVAGACGDGINGLKVDIPFATAALPARFAPAPVALKTARLRGKACIGGGRSAHPYGGRGSRRTGAG